MKNFLCSSLTLNELTKRKEREGSRPMIGDGKNGKLRNGLNNSNWVIFPIVS